MIISGFILKLIGLCALYLAANLWLQPMFPIVERLESENITMSLLFKKSKKSELFC